MIMYSSLKRVLIYLILKAGLVCCVQAFVVPRLAPSPAATLSVEQTTQRTAPLSPIRPLPTARLVPAAASLQAATDGLDDNPPQPVSVALKAAGVCSAVAWMALAVTALRYHPDPRFVHCSVKHNVLTTAQALLFPLSVMWSGFQADDRGLLLGLAVTFAYAAAATFWAPQFAFGYDLYSAPLKIGAGMVFTATSLLSLYEWKQKAGASVRGAIRRTVHALWTMCPARNETAALYATGCMGFLWFTILPIVSPYPLATVPTILGKRLSRAASAFTFLGSIQAYRLKQAADEGQLDSAVACTLKRGLGWGSAFHLILVALKLIGVDDGGLLLPGRGLWEFYPAMLAVPFAFATSLIIHACICLAVFSSPTKEQRNK